MTLTRAQHELATHVLPLFTSLVSFSPDDRAEVMAGLIGLSPGGCEAVRELLALEPDHREYAYRLVTRLVRGDDPFEIPRVPRWIDDSEVVGIAELVETALGIDDAWLVTLVDETLGGKSDPP